jgi:hypothetical protein
MPSDDSSSKIRKTGFLDIGVIERDDAKRLRGVIGVAGAALARS